MRKEEYVIIAIMVCFSLAVAFIVYSTAINVRTGEIKELKVSESAESEAVKNDEPRGIQEVNDSEQLDELTDYITMANHNIDIGIRVEEFKDTIEIQELYRLSKYPKDKMLKIIDNNVRESDVESVVAEQIDGPYVKDEPQIINYVSIADKEYREASAIWGIAKEISANLLSISQITANSDMGIRDIDDSIKSLYNTEILLSSTVTDVERLEMYRVDMLHELNKFLVFYTGAIQYSNSRMSEIASNYAESLSININRYYKEYWGLLENSNRIDYEYYRAKDLEVWRRQQAKKEAEEAERARNEEESTEKMEETTDIADTTEKAEPVDTVDNKQGL